MMQQGRQVAETEQRTGQVIGGLRDAFQVRHTDLDTDRKTLAQHVEKLQQEVLRLDSGLRLAEGEVSNVRKALGSSQEHTVTKFGEVDQAMSMFHNGVNSLRQEMLDTRD